MVVIVYAKQFLPSIHVKFSPRWSVPNENARTNLGFRLQKNIVRKRNCLSQFPLFAKRSSSQEFKDFVKPSYLLQAEEPKIITQNVPKDSFYPSRLDQSEAFYLLELSTSRDFGSGLSNLNSSIMISLIDSDNNSILQRVPSIPNSDQFGAEFVDSTHFQRGSVDTIAFKGFQLGKIEAIWVGVESGSWRLDGLQLTIINSISNDDSKFDGFQYKFEKSTISLGEGDLSIAELRPTGTIKLQGNNLIEIIPSISPNLENEIKESKEESMREYSDLKFSLLIYDLALVISGFTGLILSSFENEAYAFLLGGLIGFVYLVLLQRSVDGIPNPDLIPEGGSSEVQSFVRKPFLILGLVVLGSGIVAKYGIGSSDFVITPSELFVGAGGFWASKVSVLLAAFKPIKKDSRP